MVERTNKDGFMKYGTIGKVTSGRKSDCRTKNILIWIALALMVVVAAGCVSKPSDMTKNETVATLTTTVPPTPSDITKNETLIEEKIKSKLIGMEITYTGFGGEILKYTIKESDIRMINETVLNSRNVWKVRIGEAKAWDYYFDEKGENIVKIEQLFKT